MMLMVKEEKYDQEKMDESKQNIYMKGSSRLRRAGKKTIIEV